MADGDSELYLPTDLPYPITVVELHVKLGSNVQQGDRLLTYSFLRPSDPANKDAQPVKLFGTWDSPIEGQLSKWDVRERESVSRERARKRPALCASEPCKHGIQMGGLCALCGKDMTRSALLLRAR
jgi:RNA polymerase II subunit A-like phosphatase